MTATRETLDEFLPDAPSGGDLVGTSSGVTLARALQDLTYAVTAPITSLALRIEAYSTGNAEAIAIDHLRVSAVPELGTLSMLAVGLLGLAFYPRHLQS